MFPESSLTPENLSTVLDVMSDGRWEEFGRCVNTPYSELRRIRREYTNDRERKQALIHSFISSHPAPSWSLVAWALYLAGSIYTDDGNCHKALDRLQQLFPTGEIFDVLPSYCGTSITMQFPSSVILSEMFTKKSTVYIMLGVLGVSKDWVS